MVNQPRQLSAKQLAEARRIAKELVKLRDAGAISSDSRDPEARFYAHLVRDFGATYASNTTTTSLDTGIEHCEVRESANRVDEGS
jgi:hypothetical protein